MEVKVKMGYIQPKLYKNFIGIFIYFPYLGMDIP